MLPMDGIVLAGGQSRRMGRSKAELIVGTTTLLERAQTTLQTVCQGTVWVSRPYGFRSGDPRDLPDATPSLGPLGGIANGLTHAERELVAVLAVDLPNVTPTLFEQLYIAWKANPACDVVYAEVPGGRKQPLAALWRQSAGQHLQGLLSSGRVPRVLDVLQHLTTGVIDTSPDVLQNLNTPDDWDAWQKADRP